MQGNLKTLHVEFGRHLYGGALQVVYLMKGLAKRGHEVSLLCAKGSAIEKEARSSGIRVFPVRIAFDSDPTLLLRVYRAVKQANPDVLHLHSRRGAEIFGGLAGRMARVPAIILSRRIDDPVKLGPLGRLKFIKYPHKIITISEGIRRVLIDCGIDENRIEMVRSAVVVEQFQLERDRSWFHSEFSVPEDVPVIGVIAQLIERKGHRYLFEAVPDILKEFPDTQFILLGKGPMRQQLEHLASEMGIGKSVIFAGFRADIEKILPNLDIVVHPALREGLGVSLIQAACAGRPMVASGVGGIPEIVRDGQTGLLVNPADSQAIGKCILTLLRNPDLAQKLGENARKLAETEFSIDGMVEGNLRVYREVLRSVSEKRVHQEVG
ncbi:MAG TPA: glycosyltransferase [Armatimonadota bacterium]|nr:glycosyltransferase [Armatimonadota bacterium]HOP80706.1 glycosyltransferase [Armatimonadota bacterium]HPP75617.1 glycosyltransferase [Armatimonadota bacterium]